MNEVDFFHEIIYVDYLFFWHTRHLPSLEMHWDNI